MLNSVGENEVIIVASFPGLSLFNCNQIPRIQIVKIELYVMKGHTG